MLSPPQLVMGMRLIGAPSLAALSPAMVITKNISDHTLDVPRDNLAASIYETLVATKSRI